MKSKTRLYVALFIAMAALGVAFATASLSSYAPITGSYASNDTDIAVATQSIPSIPDPADYGAYNITLQKVTGDANGSVTLSPEQVRLNTISGNRLNVTRGQGGTIPVAINQSSRNRWQFYWNISGTATATTTAVPPTNTPTPTPIPQGTAVTSMAAGTPVPKFINNPGTGANTMWIFNQLGTDPYAAAGFADVPGTSGNTITASAATTFQWRVVY